MHSVLLARLYWTSDLQSRESKGKFPDEGGKQALLFGHLRILKPQAD